MMERYYNDDKLTNEEINKIKKNRKLIFNKRNVKKHG